MFRDRSFESRKQRGESMGTSGCPERPPAEHTSITYLNPSSRSIFSSLGDLQPLSFTISSPSPYPVSHAATIHVLRDGAWESADFSIDSLKKGGVPEEYKDACIRIKCLYGYYFEWKGGGEGEGEEEGQEKGENFSELANKREDSVHNCNKSAFRAYSSSIATTAHSIATSTLGSVTATTECTGSSSRGDSVTSENKYVVFDIKKGGKGKIRKNGKWERGVVQMGWRGLGLVKSRNDVNYVVTRKFTARTSSISILTSGYPSTYVLGEGEVAGGAKLARGLVCDQVLFTIEGWKVNSWRAIKPAKRLMRKILGDQLGEVVQVLGDVSPKEMVRVDGEVIEGREWREVRGEGDGCYIGEPIEDTYWLVENIYLGSHSR